MNVSSGGTATNTGILSSGLTIVSSGGTATSTTVSGGNLYVSTGGKASVCNVESNGALYVYSGGMVSGMSIGSRGLAYVSGGTADGAMIFSGGTLSVRSGGTAADAVVNGGVLHVSSGSRADSAVVSAGSLMISSGVVMNGATIAGGEMRVLNGGVARNIRAANGSISVSSGGKATGQLDLFFGAGVSFDAGSILDFDISTLSPGSSARVGNLSIISGTPSYTLTVAGSQKNGTYKLAESASGFAGTITVKNASGSTLGTLEVDKTVDIGGVNYTLTRSGSDLAVTIGGEPVPPASELAFFTGDFNGDLFDTLAVQKGSAVTICQNGAPWGNGLTLDPGWTVAGVGDFNGDHLNDFLRVNTEGYVVGEMSQGSGTFAAQVLNLKNPGWDILGVGDFNGDGTDDIALANTETGLVGYWQINNKELTTWANLASL